MYRTVHVGSVLDRLELRHVFFTSSLLFHPQHYFTVSPHLHVLYGGLGNGPVTGHISIVTVSSCSTEDNTLIITILMALYELAALQCSAIPRRKEICSPNEQAWTCVRRVN
jgi:hypothetical protein